MKKTGLLLVSALCALFIGCSEGQQPEPKPKPEKPAVPLELEEYTMVVGPWLDNTDALKIVSGNGGYTLVYPKYLDLYDFPRPETINDKPRSRVPYPDYLDSVVSLHIDESNNIVVEVKINDQVVAMPCFMIKDAKGKRERFEVEHYPEGIVIGGGHFIDPPGWRPDDPGIDYWANY